jgi:nitroimidazol reductase NimA-like FMN-containing flavoprotein (pyridoxamine 5'-phosphate oxidase superfamily)
MSFHVRRMDKEITDEAQLKKILRTSKYVTIALCKDNVPYLVSLSHGYDEEHHCLYFHCAKEGKKLVYLESNKTVWGQALLDFGPSREEEDCSHLYASVHFSGKAALIKDLDEKRQAINCMIKQLGKNPEALMAKLNVDRLKNTAIGRIDIDYMSGKKSKEVTL